MSRLIRLLLLAFAFGQSLPAQVSVDAVGVVVASLNAEWMQKRFGILPQNVNFAVKSDYLLNLAEMLPEPPPLLERTEKVAPDRIEPFVCLISAQ